MLVLLQHTSQTTHMPHHKKRTNHWTCSAMSGCCAPKMPESCLFLISHCKLYSIRRMFLLETSPSSDSPSAAPGHAFRRFAVRSRKQRLQCARGLMKQRGTWVSLWSRSVSFSWILAAIEMAGHNNKTHHSERTDGLILIGTIAFPKLSQ